MESQLTAVSFYVISCMPYSLAKWSVLHMPQNGHQTLCQWTSLHVTEWSPDLMPMDFFTCHRMVTRPYANGLLYMSQNGHQTLCQWTSLHVTEWSPDLMPMDFFTCHRMVSRPYANGLLSLGMPQV